MATTVPLLSQDLVQVRQRAKLFELRNTYELFDSAGTPIGTVHQVRQSALAMLARIASDLDVMLPVELEVRDGDELVRVRRKPWFSRTVEVRDAAGTSLGAIRKELRLGKARFPLVDAAGADAGVVRAENWRARDFSIQDVTGQEVGRVTKHWAGAARELLTDADHYSIHLSGGLADPLRSLAFAAPFAIDLVLKQKDAG